MIGDSKKSSFVELIKYDINVLSQSIKDHYPKLMLFIDKDDINPSLIKIDFPLFQKLVKKHCYKNIDHKIHDIDFFNVPNDRLELYEEIFFEDIISINYSPSPHSYTTSGLSSLKTYYSFIYLIFHEKFFKGVNIKTSIEKILLEWLDVLAKKKITMECELAYNKLNITENYNKSQIYQIRKEEELIISSLEPFTYYPREGLTKIIIYRQFPVLFTTKKNRRIEKKKQWEMLSKSTMIHKEIEDELRKILVALFLEGIKIPMTIPKYKSPWWLDQYAYKIQEKETTTFFRPEVQITKTNYKKSLENYDLFISMDFFNEKHYPLCNNLFRLAIENREFADWLFDLHGILEYLFAPGSSGELSFRIALNASHFISEDFEEFKSNFHFFRNFYALRSTAIHGGDWKKVYPKLLEKIKIFNDQIVSHQDLKKAMESKIIKIIAKLLNQEFEIPTFKKKIEENQLFFIENSRIIKKS